MSRSRSVPAYTDFLGGAAMAACGASAAARGLVTDPDWLAVFNFATVPLAMAALAFMAWVARQVGRAPGAWVRLAAGAVAGGAGGWSAGPLASTALVAAYAVAMTLHARREWTS